MRLDVRASVVVALALAFASASADELLYYVDKDGQMVVTNTPSRRDLKPLLVHLFADERYVTRQLVDDVLKYKRIDGVGAALQALVGTMLDGDGQAIDSIGALDQVDVPIVVLWGEQDRILPPPDTAVVAVQHMPFPPLFLNSWPSSREMPVVSARSSLVEKFPSVQITLGSISSTWRSR